MFDGVASTSMSVCVRLNGVNFIFISIFAMLQYIITY